jgi:hypothetical protein
MLTGDDNKISVINKIRILEDPEGKLDILDET